MRRRSKPTALQLVMVSTLSTGALVHLQKPPQLSQELLGRAMKAQSDLPHQLLVCDRGLEESYEERRGELRVERGELRHFRVL